MDVGRQVRNLSLIGFMGTGKSTIGRLVADALHFTFLDTDAVIEARAGASIEDIFKQHGEPVFREWEKRIVRELSSRSRTVIATGGGLPVHPENMANLKGHSLVVCLWASADKVYNRVKTQTHRPLLQNGEPLEKIRQLLALREPYYKQADVLVNTEFRSPREVAQQVMHQFHAAQRVEP
jgi:shikimate kinase